MKVVLAFALLASASASVTCNQDYVDAICPLYQEKGDVIGNCFAFGNASDGIGTFASQLASCKVYNQDTEVDCKFCARRKRRRLPMRAPD